MDWIEVTAKTVADAKELALDRLGVVEDELEIEVVDEPSRGLFRRSDARIRARVKPLSREKPNDRSRRRRGGRGRDGGRDAGRGERAERGGTGRGKAQGNGRGNGGGKGDGRGGSGATRPAAETSAGAAGAGEEGAPATGAGPSRSRRRRGGRGRGGASRAPVGGAQDVESEGLEPEVETTTMPIEEQAAHARSFTDELVRTMGFSATVRTETEEDDITVHIEGSELGLLLGPKGATMQALEEVVRAAVQHHADGRSARVHVDVAGYRQRRRDALAAFARSVAEDVLESGTPKSLEPMNAADRKLVHDTVAEIDGVATSSEGEDPRRRVVIRPA